MKKIINTIVNKLLTKVVNNCTHTISVYDHKNGYYSVCCDSCKSTIEAREYNEMCEKRMFRYLYYVLSFIIGSVVTITIYKIYYNN